MAVPHYSGKWTDGQSAGSSHVGVRIERALEIWPDGASAPILWSLHRLESAVPLVRTAKDVLIRSKDHPGQTLFVADPAFAATLLKAAPHLSPGSTRWRYAWPGLVLFALAAIAVTAAYIYDFSPAKALAAAIPYSARDAIGRQAVSSFTGGRRMCTGAAGRAALDVLAKKLSAASDAKQVFQIDVVEWDMTNAFALPGEHIVILSNLIEEAKTPDELAGVLAHEMGHGIELHPEAGIIRSIGIAAAMELIFSGSGSTLGNIGSMLLQLRYSRDAEGEADAHAKRILANAQISPKPLADFFDTLSKMEGGSADATRAQSQGSAADIFSTHPPSEARARFFREAATYPGVPALNDEQWQALKGICKS